MILMSQFSSENESGGSFSFRQFGQVNPAFLWQPEQSEGLPLVANSVIANLPQLIVSFSYVAYSGMFTSMLVSLELTRFLRQHRGLRVSSPKGSQRSTYWLSIPFRYSIPFACVMTILHWTMSESIFIVRLNYFDIYQRPYVDSGRHPGYIQTLGWSPPAIIVSLIIGVMCLAVSIIIAHRKFPSGMPLMSTCSIAISAACHRSAFEDSAMTERPLKYGMLPDAVESRQIYAGFSASHVDPLPHYKIRTGQERKAPSMNSQARHAPHASETENGCHETDNDYELAFLHRHR